jgi:hypothetical protein
MLSAPSIVELHPSNVAGCEGCPPGEGAGDCAGGPWATLSRASSLWTLQRSCFVPDVAADYFDRGENREPGRQ